MVKTYKIINRGESNCELDLELTENEAKFLENLFDMLNKSTYEGSYAPYISIQEQDE